MQRLVSGLFSLAVQLFRGKKHHQKDELLEYIIGNSRMAIAVFDREMNYLYVSQRFVEVFKPKDKNVIGKNHYEIFPDLPEKWREAHRRALKGETIGAEEDAYLYEDGSIEYTQWECRPWYEAKGAIGGVIIYTESVTDRKNVEESLKASEALYHSFVEHLPASVFRKDSQGRFVFVNKQFCLTKGLNEKDILGKTPLEMAQYYNDASANIASGYIENQILLSKLGSDHHELIMQTGKSVELEEEYVQADGAKKYFQVIKSPVFDFRGKVVGSQGVLFDITDRKRNEELLLYQRELLDTMGKVAHIGGWEYDPVTTKSNWTKELFEIHEMEPRTEIGLETIAGLFAPETFKNIIDAMNGALANVTPVDLELEFTTAKGKKKWGQIIAYPVVQDGKVVLLRGSFQDISEKKGLIHELLKAKEKVEESDRLKTAFLENMSHEIRTPMNSIMGFASLLEEEQSPELIARYSNIILRSSEQLVHIIDDIVLYSQLQTRLLSIVPRCFEVNDLIEDLWQTFSLTSLNNNVLFRTEIPTNDEIFVFSDYEKLRQVFTNLISNAYKYTPLGNITIGYLLDDGQVVFFVKDTGIGIPDEETELVFSRFYRASNASKSNVGGTGLGLSIVKELIDLVGGKIRVESKVGKGTVFYFSVPQHR